MIAKDEYIIIEKEDLDKIKAATTKTIDIKEFINFKDFDSILIEKSYYVSPFTDKTSGKRKSKQKESVVSAPPRPTDYLLVHLKKQAKSQ